MNALKIKNNGLELYSAGIPHFSRNFTRDSIISSVLMRDTIMLKNQLLFCGLKQGKNKNPITGEEPGKIFHEYPGVEFDNLNTKYNACDTTALFLIGHKFYYELSGDKTLINVQKENIKKAVEYILSHVKGGLFYEDPKFCGADRFALKVTYWKDSCLINRKNGKPSYPIVYTLAHIQNMAAIKCAGEILDSKELLKIFEQMKLNAINLLFSEGFVIAKDADGEIKGITSDVLHSLFYFDSKDLTKTQLNEIIRASKKIETSAGYRAIDPELGVLAEDKYHTKTIWPFEQAIIHIGAKKFGIEEIQRISSNIIQFLDTEPEYFIIESNKLKKAGCDPQLWTIAAKKYFESL